MSATPEGDARHTLRCCLREEAEARHDLMDAQRKFDESLARWKRAKDGQDACRKKLKRLGIKTP